LQWLRVCLNHHSVMLNTNPMWEEDWVQCALESGIWLKETHSLISINSSTVLQDWWQNCSKWYLPIELSPIKIGVVFIKFCNSKWLGHKSSDESCNEIFLHFLQVNCHSIGRNQNPQTSTFDGQYSVNALKLIR